MSEKQIITFENVSLNYRDKRVLENVSFSLTRGNLYAIIGPNGAGKTTLLKLIMGLLKPSTGRVQVHAASLGYIPQSLSFDPLFPLSVYELVMMGSLSKLTWYGRYPKSESKKALKALDQVSLLSMKDRSLRELSGGQLQRAFIARAIMDDPELLLLDEPTTGLDPGAKETILTFLEQHKGKRTILMVTHELSSILSASDQIICMHDIVEIVSPKSICEHVTMGIYHKDLGATKNNG